MKSQQIVEESPEKQIPPPKSLLIMDHRFRDEITESLKTKYSLEDLRGLAISLRTNDVALKHKAIIGIRKIISSTLFHTYTSIQEVINERVVPRLVSLAKQRQHPHLRLEAAWALSNIASGNTSQCEEVVNRGGIQLFVKLLKDKKFKIIEQAVWGIGNIASAKPLYRDAIITKGGITKLLKFSKKFSNQRLLKHCCWAISTLCRGSPLPQSERVRSGVVFLCKVLAKEKIKDDNIIIDCCWAISNHVRHILSSESDLLRILIPQLIAFCSRPHLSMILPVIRTIGKLTLMNSCTNDLITHGVVPVLKTFIKHSKKMVRREACWVISNITTGTQEQLSAVIRDQELIKSLVDCFGNDNIEVKREVCFIFSNLAQRSDPQMIYRIYRQHKIVGCYCRLLDEYEANKQAVIQCLCKIVASAKKLSEAAKLSVTQELQEFGIIPRLEKLQCRQSDCMVDHAKRLMTYFNQKVNVQS